MVVFCGGLWLVVVLVVVGLWLVVGWFCLVGWFFWWSGGPVVAGWVCCSWFGSFLLAGVLVGWSCGGVVVPVAVGVGFCFGFGLFVPVVVGGCWCCWFVSCLVCFVGCWVWVVVLVGLFVVLVVVVCAGVWFSRLVRLDARWPEYRGPLQTCRHFDGCGHL